MNFGVKLMLSKMESLERYRKITTKDYIKETSVFYYTNTGYHTMQVFARLIRDDKMEWNLYSPYEHTMHVHVESNQVIRRNVHLVDKAFSSLVITQNMWLWEETFTAQNITSCSVSCVKDLDDLDYSLDVILTTPLMYEGLARRYRHLAWKRVVFDTDFHPMTNAREIIFGVMWIVCRNSADMISKYKNISSKRNFFRKIFGNIQTFHERTGDVTIADPLTKIFNSMNLSVETIRIPDIGDKKRGEGDLVGETADDHLRTACCPICHSTVHDQPHVLDCCKSEFCHMCILKWCKISSTCPMCRAFIEVPIRVVTLDHSIFATLMLSVHEMILSAISGEYKAIVLISDINKSYHTVSIQGKTYPILSEYSGYNTRKRIMENFKNTSTRLIVVRNRKCFSGIAMPFVTDVIYLGDCVPENFGDDLSLCGESSLRIHIVRW